MGVGTDFSGLSYHIASKRDFALLPRLALSGASPYHVRSNSFEWSFLSDDC
jgi:hypothetical protein